MSNFEDTLARMKVLYTYGAELNEDNRPTNYSIEYKMRAADGNTYGIIRECSKYYIKKAPKVKENISEAYEYIGGFNNKKKYEYDSYSNALKNLEMKIDAINEAYEGNVNTSTLNPSRREEYLVECTEDMKKQIARYREIFENASAILGESVEYPISRKDDVVMYDGKNPEAETCSSSECTAENGKETKADPEYKGSKTNGLKKEADPFNRKPSKTSDRLSEGIEDDENCPDCEEDNYVCPKCGEDICICNDEDDTDDFTIGDTDEIEEVSDEEANDNDSDVEFSLGDLDSDENGDETDDLDTDDEVSDEFGDDEDLLSLDSELNSDEEEEDDDDYDETGDESESEDELEDDFDSENPNDFEDEDDEDIESNESEAEVEDNEDNEFTIDDFDEDEDEDEDEIDADEHDIALMEMRRRSIDKIVEATVKAVLKEENLNVFGKHPGYRKKPMTLPPTGDDNNEHGRDWNDKSVASEEPFGTKIGDGAPYSKAVLEIANEVKKAIAKQISSKKKMK